MAMGADGKVIKCCVKGCNKGIKLNVYLRFPHVPDDKYKCYKHYMEHKRAKQNNTKKNDKFHKTHR